MVDEDLLLRDAEGEKAVSLGGEVLVVGRDAGVPDLHSRHAYKLWSRAVRYYAREVRDRAQQKAKRGDQR